MEHYIIENKARPESLKKKSRRNKNYSKYNIN